MQKLGQEHTLEKRNEKQKINVKEIIVAIYFKIQTSRDLIDLSKESTKYEKASNKSLRSNQVKVQLGSRIFGWLAVDYSIESINLYQTQIQTGHFLLF